MLAIGIVLARRLYGYEGFHFGLVVKNKPRLEILEFDGSNLVSKVDLLDFLNGENELWEMLNNGHEEYSKEEAVRRGLEIYKKQNFGNYYVLKNNCENFVNKCRYKNYNECSLIETMLSSKKLFAITLVNTAITKLLNEGEYISCIDPPFSKKLNPADYEEYLCN